MALNPKVVEWITNMNLALVAKFGAGAPQIDVTDATGFITANIGTIIEEPVAGEPSLGTPHQKPRDNTSRITSNGVTPPSGSWSAAQSAAAYISAGANRFKAHVEISYTATGLGQCGSRVYFGDNTTYTPALGYAYPSKLVWGYCAGAGAFVQVSENMDIPVDVSGNYYIQRASDTNVSAISVTVTVLDYDC